MEAAIDIPGTLAGRTNKRPAVALRPHALRTEARLWRCLQIGCMLPRG